MSNIFILFLLFFILIEEIIEFKYMFLYLINNLSIMNISNVNISNVRMKTTSSKNQVIKNTEINLLD